MGIYARATGDYFLAMQNHTHSAYLAREAGDAQGEAISGFCATMERVNYGLVTIPESVRSMLIELREAGKRLYEALEGKTDDADAIRWAYLNAPVHLLTAHFWAGEKYDSAEDRRA